MAIPPVPNTELKSNNVWLNWFNKIKEKLNSFISLFTIDAGSNITVPANFNATRYYASVGTAALPSYSFTGDTDTGFYSPGANTIAWVTNGVARVAISSSGNVGINTITPNATLEVSSSSDPRIALTGGVGSVGSIDFRGTGGALSRCYISADATTMYFATNGATRLVLKNGGSLRLVPLAADPVGTEHGDIWALTSGVFRRNRNGTIETW